MIEFCWDFLKITNALSDYHTSTLPHFHTSILVFVALQTVNLAPETGVAPYLPASIKIHTQSPYI
jgi:hypothetical protein